MAVSSTGSSSSGVTALPAVRTGVAPGSGAMISGALVEPEQEASKTTPCGRECMPSERRIETPSRFRSEGRAVTASLSEGKGSWDVPFAPVLPEGET